MSDNESNYYSDSSEDSDNESVKVVSKNVNKPVNAAKKYGNYIEDESEVDDSEPDDADIDDADEENEDDNQEVGVDEDTDADEEDTKGDEDPDEEAEEEEEEEVEENVDDEEPKETITKTKSKTKKVTQLIVDDDDDDNEYQESYLQKFDSDINKNYIEEFHPECLKHNYDEVLRLSKVVRDETNMIVDPLHKTLPYLTKYEKARILGQRAKQIETGSKPFVKVPENIIDSYVIAELELGEKKIPFIIKRPIPNGAFEYWHLKDLEIISF